ncbi:NAD-dependent formate dehydrogenase domain protein [Francisella tularensis subsp. holarctica]|nr:NAD-dependent formate dehydrogenase domain protein [Francisella tularensis subsp. holarctica]AJI59680.1 NAD-dependent formate dehydrogenase domain protein [Francisella tularensis subsp. holarctica LVS]AJI64097.1 NAD-dependent formate dehydrogenase domain protein [Francisella tularensis subsp. holarctica]AJI66697.1 NAD-dependent formate dehydrogenase domain protein [Francisella tularensis subsp. holarctica]
MYGIHNPLQKIIFGELCLYNGMTPHTSGTTLSAQARYAAGTREILECFFSGKEIRDEYYIVKNGELAGVGAHSYK